MTSGSRSPSPVADNWVSLDLGARGKVAVHFYPRRTAPLPPRGGYAGQDGRQLLGVWKGTITFTGEHRYATVHTRVTPGTVVLNPGLASDPNCGQVVTVGPTDIPGPFFLTTLTMEAAHAGSTDLFDAYMAQGVSTVEFKADATRRAHESGCSVERLAPAGDLTPSSDLDWNAQTAPSSATLTPPAPFTERANMQTGRSPARLTVIPAFIPQHEHLPIRVGALATRGCAHRDHDVRVRI